MGSRRIGKVEDITLREFDISTIPDNSSCLYIGGRNTGKTTNIYNLLYSKRNKFDTAMVICPTSRVNGSFQDIVPRKFIHEDYSASKVNELIKRQERILEKKKAHPARYGHCTTTTCLLLDDMAFDKTWQADKNLRLMAMNGRHYDALFIISLQYCLTMKPDLRNNFQYIFLHRTTNHKEKMRLHEYFAGMFRYYDQFERIFDEITADYGCMVIDANCKSNRLEDYVFYFNPQPRDDLTFTICSKRHWEVGAEICSQASTAGGKVRTFRMGGGGGGSGSGVDKGGGGGELV